MYQIFAKAAILLLVVIVLGLARRYAPDSANKPASFPSITELESRFSVTQWIVAAAMIALALLIFNTIHEVLIAANYYLAAADGPADFILPPQTAIWWFLPGFAAVILAWDVTLWAWSLIGSKQTVLQYEYWTNAKVGFDSTKILQIMAGVILLPIALLTGFALPRHDSLQETVIHSHPYGLSGARIFQYSNAKNLAVIEGFRNTNGHFTRRADCVLYFADGSKWSSATIGEFKPTVDTALLQFLERKKLFNNSSISREPCIT